MLSKEEREYLKQARHAIAKGQEEFICLALKYQCGEKETHRLRTYIRTQLGGRSYTTLEDWQWWRGIKRSPRQTRKDRLDWIDWMLGEK